MVLEQIQTESTDKWVGRVTLQSRAYAVADLEAYIDVQAMQAAFDKDSCRLHHHLGRAAIAVDKSWYDVLVPGLTTTSELSIRRQEVLQAHKKLTEAYWQALPINVLKYGMKIVAGLPSVVGVMQTDQYASFSVRVLQAECDSMEKLQMMQEVPYLAEWRQANYARAESRQVAYHATSTSTESSGTIEQSQVRSAEAAGIVTQEPAAKRQKIASSAADMEEQMQAALDHLRFQRRQKELQLQIDKEKEKILELDQLQEDLRTRKMMSSSAQGSSALKEQVMSAAQHPVRMFNSATHLSLLKFRIRLCWLAQALLKVAMCLQHSQTT